jgi:hypothetical protein
LKAVFLAETFLEGGKSAVGGGNAFDSRDGRAVALNRQNGTRFHSVAVNVDGTRPATRRVATDVRPRQPHFVAEMIDEQLSGFDFVVIHFTIYGNGNWNFHLSC